MTSKRRRFAVVLLAVALSVIACGPKPDNSRVRLPDPVESATLGPGDVFTVQIVGEKDLPSEYQVASDGTVDIPYIHRLKVAGLEPQEVADLLRRRFMEDKILVNPSIVVKVTAYNSKLINVLGQVQKPGSFPLVPGMTLVQAISQAGGFSGIANRDRINLVRKTKTGTRTVVVSVDAITDGTSPDIPLQAGDQIYVNERIF